MFTLRDRDFVAHRMDVEQCWEQFLAGEGKVWWNRDPVAHRMRVRRALDSVLEFRRLWRMASVRAGLDVAYEAVDETGESFNRIEAELILYPAPDHAALGWKLENLFGKEAREPDGMNASYCVEWIEAVMADVHRLLIQDA